MAKSITNNEAMALVRQGWHYDSVHIGGRGYVDRVWNAEHVYELSGIDRWYLLR